jgi:hypothetical protein
MARGRGVGERGDGAAVDDARPALERARGDEGSAAVRADARGRRDRVRDGGAAQVGSAAPRAMAGSGQCLATRVLYSRPLMVSRAIVPPAPIHSHRA